MFSNITEEIIKGTFSNRYKDSKYEKATFKKILINDEEIYQFSFFTKTQVFHENYSKSILTNKLEEILRKYFIQLNMFSSNFSYDYKLTSKGKLLSNKKINQVSIIEDVKHNKEKNYLLKEGTVVPPLVDLGVMLDNGMVVKKYYDKYRQINKFLEIIEDTIKNEDKLTIIDFGCGKSYLTFILYYYLVYVKKIETKIIGLDLKKEVINECNTIKEKFGYNNLSFELGDISLFQPQDKVDMIITLHACDTATDFALYHAIKLKAKYIFSAPCCQHELNSQMNRNIFEVINKYGLLKERFSSIMTDAIRANILEYFGYSVNVMEFIDITHSPKNVLIKGVLTEDIRNEKIKKDVLNLVSEYRIKQTLVELVFKENS